MFEEENQIENQVENQEPKIDSEKKTAEPAVVKKRIIARRHRKEEAPASPAASASQTALAANPVPENTEGRSKLTILLVAVLSMHMALWRSCPKDTVSSGHLRTAICQVPTIFISPRPR